MENDEDYLLQQELEALAGNVFDPSTNNSVDESGSSKAAEPMSVTIDRWKNLFGLPADDAVQTIQMHRDNLMRARVSDEHWEVVRLDHESRGYDRETYEYELEMQRRKAALPAVLPTERRQDDQLKYLVEMEGPLSTTENVQKAAGMSTPPAVVAGRSLEEGRSVSFVLHRWGGQGSTSTMGCQSWRRLRAHDSGRSSLDAMRLPGSWYM